MKSADLTADLLEAIHASQRNDQDDPDNSPQDLTDPLTIAVLKYREAASELEQALEAQRRETEQGDLIAALSQVLMTNPVTAKAFLRLLIHEGEAYLATEEGAQMASALANSGTVQKLDKLLQVISPGFGDPADSSILPSTYVEALLMAAQSKNYAAILKGSSSD